MVEPQDIHRKAQVLARLLARKYGATGDSLTARRRRVGRLLPRRVRRAVEEVERAQGLAGHPRIALTLDPQRIDTAYREARAHLDKVGPHDQLKSYVLGVLAVNAFNALVIFGVLLAVARWQGWV